MQSGILLESCREVLEQCGDEATQKRRNISVDSNASVPLIFDARGDFVKLARKVRNVDGPDVPTKSQANRSNILSADRVERRSCHPRITFRHAYSKRYS